MTTEERKKIEGLRSKGYGYKRIAEELDIPLGTVKSYCRRNEVNGTEKRCPVCGKLIEANKIGHPRKYCSKKCRDAYWREHTDMINSKSARRHVCKCCGKEFRTYRDDSKFCSTGCYMAYRFGGVGHEEEQV